jgi:drug/metabolite transporter (DMT)-like permease
VFVTAMWGLGITGAKEVMTDTPTLLGCSARFVLAGLLLLAIARRTGVPPERRAPWRTAVVLGVLQTAGLFGFAYSGMQHTEASVASVVLNATPLLAVLFAVPVLGERLRREAVAGLVLGLAGILLVSGGGEGGVNGWLGMVAVGTVCWAAATVGLKLVGPVDPLSLAGRQMLVGSAFLLVASLLFDEWRWDPTPATAAWFAFLVLPATAAAYAVWFPVVERHSVSRLGPFMLLTPVFGVGGAVLLRGEHLHWGLAGGTVLVIAGIALAQRSSPVATIETAPALR